MKTQLRTAFLAIASLLATSSLYAQLSDLHYLPPLKQRTGAFVEQLIYVTTPEATPFTVNVYEGTATTPTHTLTISNTSSATINPGNGDNGKTLLIDSATGYVQSTAGYRFEAPSGKKFYVNWRGRSGSQGSSLTSKGRSALGTAFKWVGVPNMGNFYEALSNSLGIMATEDSTSVVIYGYNPNVDFRLGTSIHGITSDEVTITLNKGQTFVLEATDFLTNPANSNGWLGASINSNKPIAVSFGQLHVQPQVGQGSRDAAIDQIIPESLLGKEYIFVRGRGTNETEFPIIIATQNNTQIFVNNETTPIATINAGKYFAIPASKYSGTFTSAAIPGENMYVRTSKEVYAVQSLAGDLNVATVDVNFIAPVSCLLSSEVNKIPDVSNVAGQTITGGVTIIASTAIAEADIKVTVGGTLLPTATITAARKTVSGTSEWKTYYLPGLVGDVKVSATGPIAVGYLGYSGVVGASGYFSGFETIPSIEVERVGNGCLPSTILKATAGFASYTWYRDGVLIPGVTGNTYTPDKAGKFTVMVANGSCYYLSANQYIYDCNPEIVVKTTANKNGIISGEQVRFDVSVSVFSDIDVNNLVVTNLLPSNVTIDSTKGTRGTVTNSGSTYTWSVGTMRNGEEHILSIYAKGKTVASATPGTLTVSKTQTIIGTELNKIPDDWDETVTVYPALSPEPTTGITGLFFTNTGSAHPFNNVMYFNNAQGADGYLVVRSKTGPTVFAPVDGTGYTTSLQGNDEIIYIGSDTVVTDFSATANVNYYYTIYPYSGGGNASNYRTTAAVRAVINNRVLNEHVMPASAISTSAGIATEGVNVTFTEGLASGTTIAATKFKADRPAGYTYGLPAGLVSVRATYFTVTSTLPNPGVYTLTLDFSNVPLNESDWATVRLLKRSGEGQVWQDITSYIVDRSTDGILGKFLIKGLTGFSDFALGSSEYPLPVVWQQFTAKAVNNTVELNWTTASESNTEKYVVEYSNNGMNWVALGSVDAAGNTSSQSAYSFVHTQPSSGANYYRIMQRDRDGAYTYSAVRKVNLDNAAHRVLILGNPVENNMLRISTSESQVISIKSIDGRTLLTRNLTAGVHQLALGKQAPGTYLLVAENEVIKFVIK